MSTASQENTILALNHSSSVMPNRISPYVGFDDRPYIIFGIFFLGFTIPIFFFQGDVFESKEIFLQEFLEACFYVSIYWIVHLYIVIQLRKKYNKFDESAKRLWIQLAVLIVVLPIVGSLTSGIIDLVYFSLGLVDKYDPSPIQSIITTYVVSLALSLLYEVIYYMLKYKDAILSIKDMEHARTRDQLENLRNQINPHFLFNSMNTLMSLIPQDSDRAMKYLSELSKFYRYTVSNQDEALVPLSKELNHVSSYIGILQERFQKGIIIDIPKDIPSDAKTLPLCLQLLIENAVKHNVVGSRKPLRISISFIKENTYIEVSNNIQKRIQEVKSTGMGLKNIQKRVSYFSKNLLLINSTSDQFSVAIPLIF